MKFNASVAIALVLLLLVSKPVVERFRPDYMQIAARTPWRWSDEQATADFCAAHLDAAYRVESTLEKWARVSFTLWQGKRRVYGWIGHEETVFTISGRRLYYADFGFCSCGGSIVAVDLTTEREMWRQPLLAIGDWGHSKYLNEMNLQADDRTVTVFGKESCGRYVEIKDAATGRTLGHHAYDRYGMLPMLHNPYPPVEAAIRVRLLRSMRLGLSLALLAVAIPVLLARLRRARRERSGRCRSCGYDLRASVERCPECGRAIMRAVA